MNDSKSPIQLVAIDLDGTLLDSDHQLSQRNSRAIRDAIALGVKIILATGKTRSSAVHLIEELGITSPGIYMQGLITYNADGSIRRQQVMDKQLAQRVIDLGDSRGFRGLLYHESRSFSLQPDDVTAGLSEHGESPAEKAPDWRSVLDRFSINKIILYSEERHVKGLRDAIDRELDGNVHVTRANIEGMVEVLPRDASKGHSLKVLMEELGINPQRALAIGDGENDLEMLNAVGLGIAMENATQLLKDAADDIVPSNDDDGVAVALEKYVIGSKVGQR